MVFKVYLKGYSPRELAEALEKQPGFHDVDFDWKDEDIDQKAFSPEVAALIVSGISGVVTLLVAILDFVKSKSQSTVIVKDKFGRMIQIKSSSNTPTPSDEVARFVEVVHSMEQPRITLIRNKE